MQKYLLKNFKYLVVEYQIFGIQLPHLFLLQSITIFLVQRVQTEKGLIIQIVVEVRILTFMIYIFLINLFLYKNLYIFLSLGNDFFFL